VRGLDVAKALLEEGFHSPTVYFPLIVEEALMFEPTETESLQTARALSLHRAPQSGVTSALRQRAHDDPRVPWRIELRQRRRCRESTKRAPRG
jgi:glycine cleavage system protein P-like pyridoxal-binding family